MKARLIGLKTLPAREETKDLACDYRALLLEQLNRVDAQSGLSVSDIEQRLAARKSLMGSGDTWIASEEEFQMVKTALSTQRWAVVSENLVQFIHDVNSAAETDIGTTDGLRLVKEN